MVDKVMLEKTIKAISEAPPERIIMNSWLTGGRTLCDTAGCIAGWVAIISYKTHPAWANTPVPLQSKVTTNDLLDLNIYTRASEVLGLTFEQSEQLFHMSGCMDSFRALFAEYGIKRLGGTYIQSSYVKSPTGYFDELPGVFRKSAVLEVLTHLLAWGTINWPRALREAAKGCGWDIVKNEAERNYAELENECRTLRAKLAAVEAALTGSTATATPSVTQSPD